MAVLYKKIFFGEIKNQNLTNFKDIDSCQKGIMAVFAGLVIFFGVYPKPILKPIETSSQSTLQIAYERTHNDKSKERIEYSLYPYSRKAEIIPTIPSDILQLQEEVILRESSDIDALNRQESSQSSNEEHIESSLDFAPNPTNPTNPTNTPSVANPSATKSVNGENK